MAEPLIAGIPPGIELDGSSIVRVVAVDPTTGAQVAGVTVSAFVMVVDSGDVGGGAALAYGPFMLVPGPAG